MSKHDDGGAAWKKLQEEFDVMMEPKDHPVALDAAERAAVASTGTLTPLPTEQWEATRAGQQAGHAYDCHLAQVEAAPWGHEDPATVEQSQARAIEALRAQIRAGEILEPGGVISEQFALWAVSKIAQSENSLADLVQAYEAEKREWETRIKLAKRELEIRQGCFSDLLEAYGQANLPAGKKSMILGPRKLAYRDEKEKALLEDKQALIERIKQEDPYLSDGRLAIEYKVADLDDEKRRALARLRESGEIPAGFSYEPAKRRFTIQKPKGDEA